MAPDRERLRLFAAVLLVLAAALVVASSIVEATLVQLAPVYMFTPIVAGLVVCLRHGVSLSSVGLRAGRPRWLGIALLASLPMVALTLALSLLAPGVSFDPTADPLPGFAVPDGVVGLFVTLGLVLAVGATVNAVFAFGEEFGWRGYLLWELAPLGFWKASIAVGVVWGLWHSPIILAGYNYPSFPVVGVALMTLACVAFSPLYTYLVVRAESLLAAAFLHGVFNGSAGIVLVYAIADDPALRELVASPVGVAGIAAFALVAAGLHYAGVPALDRQFATARRDG